MTSDVLNKDIEDLIVATRMESTQNPHDSGIQTRLKALMDLQSIVRSGGLPQDQLVLVRKQVDELAVKMRVPTPSLPPQVGSGGLQPVPAAAHVVPTAHFTHPPPSSSTTPQVPTPTVPASATPVTIDSLLGKGALAALLAQQAKTSANTTPSPVVPTPPPASIVPAAPAPASDPMSVIQQLRQAGLLGGAAPTPSQAPAAPAPSASSALASLPSVIQKALSPMKATPPPPPPDPRVISWDLGSLQLP